MWIFTLLTPQSPFVVILYTYFYFNLSLCSYCISFVFYLFVFGLGWIYCKTSRHVSRVSGSARTSANPLFHHHHHHHINHHHHRHHNQYTWWWLMAMFRCWPGRTSSSAQSLATLLISIKTQAIDHILQPLRSRLIQGDFSKRTSHHMAEKSRWWSACM